MKAASFFEMDFPRYELGYFKHYTRQRVNFLGPAAVACQIPRSFVKGAPLRLSLIADC